MNLLTKIKVIIFISVISIGFCLFLYWLGGGNFERNPDLALTVGLGLFVGLIVGFTVAVEDQ